MVDPIIENYKNLEEDIKVSVDETSIPFEKPKFPYKKLVIVLLVTLFVVGSVFATKVFLEHRSNTDINVEDLTPLPNEAIVTPTPLSSPSSSPLLNKPNSTPTPKPTQTSTTNLTQTPSPTAISTPIPLQLPTPTPYGPGNESDKNPPVTNIYYPSPGGYIGYKIDNKVCAISTSPTDDYTKTTDIETAYSFDGGEWSGYSKALAYLCADTLLNGDHVLLYRSRDISGHEEDVRTLNFVVSISGND